MERIKITKSGKIVTIVSLLFFILSYQSTIFSQEIGFEKLLVEKKFSYRDSLESHLNDSVVAIGLEWKLLEFLIKNKQNLKKSKRNQIRFIFGTIATTFSELDIRKEATFQYIDMYCIASCSDHKFPKKLFTQKTIDRAIEIINIGRTKEEALLIYEGRLVDKVTQNKSVKKHVTRIMKERNCDFDSAIVVFKEYYYPFHHKKIEVTDLIKLIGFLGKTEYASMFEKLLEKEMPEESQKQIILSLARMNYKNYGKKYIDLYKVNESFDLQDFFDLSFIGSQELLWHYIESNSDNDNVLVDKNWEGALYTRLSICMYNASKTVSNCPIKFKIPLFKKTKELPLLKAQSEKAYKWFKENRGNYKMINWYERGIRL